MKRGVIYLYGKTVESIEEKYMACNKALSNGRNMKVYVDIQGSNGVRPGLTKLIEDINLYNIKEVYIAGVHTISRKPDEYMKIMEQMNNKGTKIVDVYALNK